MKLRWFGGILTKLWFLIAPGARTNDPMRCYKRSLYDGGKQPYMLMMLATLLFWLWTLVLLGSDAQNHKRQVISLVITWPTAEFDICEPIFGHRLIIKSQYLVSGWYLIFNIWSQAESLTINICPQQNLIFESQYLAVGWMCDGCSFIWSQTCFGHWWLTRGPAAWWSQIMNVVAKILKCKTELRNVTDMTDISV